MSSAQSVDVKPTVSRFGLKQLMFWISAICIGVAFLHPPITQALNNQSHSNWPRGSPFTRVELDGDKVMVEFNDANYELISINGEPTEKILAKSHRLFGSYGDKRFVEDLPQVLGSMGMENTESVDLVLLDGGGNQVAFRDAPVTPQNRSRVYQSSTYGTSRLGFDDLWTRLVLGCAVGWLLYSLSKDLKKLLAWRRNRVAE